MIFVSDRDYYLSFRGPRKLHYPNGEIMETRPRIFARFTHGGAPDAVLRFALVKLNFSGLPENMLPEERLHVWDSVQAQREHDWKDEEREDIEKYMLGKLERGETRDYMLYEPEVAPKPWENYNRIFETSTKTPEKVAKQIYDLAREIGADPQVVIAYERENKNREEVIREMERLASEMTEKGEVVAA